MAARSVMGPAGAPMKQQYGSFAGKPAFIVAIAIYRLLVDHYLATGYATAGTIVTEGIQIPIGWPPTIGSEPINAQAIQKFWNFGPKAQNDAESGRDKFWQVAANFAVGPPVIYWKSIGNGLFQLTGAGASLGPRSAT